MVKGTGPNEIEFGIALWQTSLRCDNVFRNSTLRGTFIEDLTPSIKVYVRNYLESHPHLNLHKLVRYAFSVGQFHRSKSVVTGPTLHSGQNMTGRSNVSHLPVMHIDHNYTTPSSYTEFKASEEVDRHNDPLIMALKHTAA